MIKSKITALGVPLLVGLVFGLVYRCMIGVEAWWDFSIWGYLWYVHDMLIVFIFYYTIKRYVKSNKWFLIITGIVFVTTSVIHAFPMFYSWGYFRAFSAMSLGILISYIPPIKIKRKWVLVIPLVCIWALILRMFLFDFSFIEDELLNLVLYPALIYLTFQFNVYSITFNYLGALSFGLYAYQSITRVMEVCGYENRWVFFAIIFTLSVLTDLVKRLVKLKRKQKIKEIC